METKIFDKSIEVLEGDSFCYASLNQETELDEEGDEIVTEEYVLIDKLFVAEDQRRQGLGRKLLRTCIEAINDKFGLTIKLAALPDNEDIISQNDLVAFYESEGFTPDDEQGGAGVVMVY